MTDILGATRNLGKCLREGKEMYMGVPAENVCIAAADEIERLRGKIKTVLETFERDEAQGYHSKDRQFAISILKD